ncbi:HU family DNA-binding protein [Trujillonella endophytica]|uniref:DNA-binding protein HU-beta n=1 Tax=Trujillonella endophytica TaxID=673521 RepID=A0A1H8SGD6_9ACTN|nr:HU family DNA-binding protein [Trujillella endophytica]SEO77617.1 DNA-binding protein HU-beta [Trujillella endophytica]
MNKSDLIAKMAERLDGDRTTAVAAVNGVLEEIESSVARGERVSLTGFGTFEGRERAARTGRNPRTGEAIQLDASVVPVFRAGTGFRALLTEARGEPTSRASAAGEGTDPTAGGKKSRVASSASAGSSAGVDAAADGSRKKGGKKARQQAAGKVDGSAVKAGKNKHGKKASKDAR